MSSTSKAPSRDTGTHQEQRVAKRNQLHRAAAPTNLLDTTAVDSVVFWTRHFAKPAIIDGKKIRRKIRKCQKTPKCM